MNKSLASHPKFLNKSLDLHPKYLNKSLASDPKILNKSLASKPQFFSKDNDLTSKNNSLYLYFNEKKLKPHLDSLYITRASKYLLSSHLLNFIFHQDNFRCQTATSIPCGTTCACKLCYTGFMHMIMQQLLRHTSITTSFATGKLLDGRSWPSKL